MEFSPVTAVAKANVYFDGGVVSHAIIFPDGERKTLGIIREGSYHFGTETAENMKITDGSCNVLFDGTTEYKTFSVGEEFDVAANSGFTIAVTKGLCQYVCSYLK